MKTQIKYLALVFIIILVTTSVSAVDVLKPAKLDANYTVIQTCASCTSVNITISNVNGIVTSNQEMTDNGSGVWVFDIVPTITSRYDVTGIGDLDGEESSFVTFFPVTPSGKISATGDSILYALFTFMIFGAIFIISFIIFTLPSTNEKDEQGFENKIVKLKYIRIIFLFLLWPLTILLLNLLNGLATNFSALSLFSGILGFLFESMLRLSWPFTVIIIAWIIFMLVHDTNVNKLLDKFDRFNPSNP